MCQPCGFIDANHRQIFPCLAISAEGQTPAGFFNSKMSWSDHLIYNLALLYHAKWNLMAFMWCSRHGRLRVDCRSLTNWGSKHRMEDGGVGRWQRQRENELQVRTPLCGVTRMLLKIQASATLHSNTKSFFLSWWLKLILWPQELTVLQTADVYF